MELDTYYNSVVIFRFVLQLLCVVGRIKKCTNGQINFYLREKLPLHLSRIIRNLDPKNKLILPLRFYSFDVSLSHN